MWPESHIDDGGDLQVLRVRQVHPGQSGSTGGSSSNHTPPRSTDSTTGRSTSGHARVCGESTSHGHLVYETRYLHAQTWKGRLRSAHWRRVTSVSLRHHVAGNFGPCIGHRRAYLTVPAPSQCLNLKAPSLPAPFLGQSPDPASTHPAAPPVYHGPQHHQTCGMASWGRKGGLMGFLSESLGFMGTRNVAAWVLAGGIVYALWYVPQRQEEARRKVRVTRRAVSSMLRVR